MQAAAYIRVSSGMQVEAGSSLPSQLAAIKDYAGKNGLEIVQTFSDEGESARTADRPAFQEMIGLAKTGPPWGAIVCWETSRFARSREDAIIYKALLRKRGIALHFVKQSFDDGPAGKLLEGILETIDEWYSENLAVETKRGQRETARQGFSTGGRPPYGLRRVEVQNVHGAKKAKWEPDPETAPVVRRIFEAYASGQGYKKIAYSLNAEGIPAPRGTAWNANTLHYLIHRNQEAYLGNQIYGREDNQTEGVKERPREEWTLVEGAWEPILPLGLIEAARARKSTYRPRASTAAPEKPFFLSGKLFCGLCGSACAGSTGGRKAQTWRYYRCNRAKSSGPSACDLGVHSQARVEGAVREAIRETFLSPEVLRNLYELHNEKAAAMEDENQKRLVQLEKSRAEEERRKDNLLRAVSRGLIADEDISLLLREVKCNLNDLNRRIGEIMNEGTPITTITDKDIAEMGEMVNSWLERGNFGLGKLTESLVERVELFPDKIVVTFLPAVPATKKTAHPGNGAGRLSDVGGEGCPSSLDKRLRVSVTRGL